MIRALSLGLGALGFVFGLLTLVAGGSVVFDVGTARADHGDYVPFVLIFNFLSGFVYLAAGAGIALRQRWAAAVGAAIVVGLAVTGAALGVHVASGGAYETETVAAMAFRFTLWVGLTTFSYRTTRRHA